MTELQLDRLLAPSSVAVIGSTSRDTGLGRRVLRHLEAAGFAGEIVIGDPQEALPRPVDVAAIAVPALHVQGVLDRLEGRAASAIVMSSGFEEVGSGPLHIPDGMALIGPNSVGLYRAASRCVLTFAQAFDDLVDCEPGAGAFLISQSGAFGVRLARAARASGFPLDGFIGTGNETDQSAADIARAVIASPTNRPRVLMLYLETVRDVDGLLAALADARDAGVPVAVLYGGRTSSGASAALSHTSALSTDFGVLSEALNWLGARIVRTDRELLIAARALADAGPARGRRVAIVTGSGGAGVVAADSLEDHGLILPRLSPALEQRVASMLPAFASSANPVDVTAQVVGDAALVGEVCRTIAESGEVDVVLAIGRAAFAPELGRVGAVPMVLGLLDGLNGATRLEGVAIEGDLDAATTAVASLCGEPLDVPRTSPIHRALKHLPRADLSASDSMTAFAEAGIRVAPWGTARTSLEARELADRLGYPVVVKSDGHAGVHKALAGGVRLDVSETGIEQVATELLAASGSIIVAQQLRPSLELFVGVRDDERFGILVTAGLGGSHAELIGRTLTMPGGIPEPELAARLDADVLSRGGERYRALATPLAAIARHMVDLCSRGYSLVEANPIAVVDGELLALDARVVTHD